MCRLYGIRANEPTKVECSLVYAQNALMRQSRADGRGQAHSDGWGIGFYENGQPVIEKRELAAWEDLHFSSTAERVYARTVVAHVRNATVGRIGLENTHPFTLGHWLFAHNGTVRPTDRLRPLLERETSDDLRSLCRGDTDSELVFYWLLSRLRERGIELQDRASPAPRLARILAESIAVLVERSRVARTKRPSMLNFMLTDGVHLLASRHNRTLYRLERVNVRDCEICGIPHVRHDPEVEYRAAIIASEPITGEDWVEVPEGSVVAIGEQLETEIVAIEPGAVVGRL